MTVARECDLCGLGCGKHPLEHHVHDSACFFCCLGCLNVYLILWESGAIQPGRNPRDTELFQRSLKLGLISNRIDSESSAPPSAPANTEELLLHVSGMWCTSCSWLIEHALSKLPGIAKAEASFASDLVKVHYIPQSIPREHILSRITSLGYQSEEYSANSETDDAERRDWILRTGIAAFLWINVMSLSLTLYAGYFEQISGSVRRGLPFVLMALATPVVFYCGQPVLRLAWRGLLNRTLRMETLLSIGILAAYGYSVAQAFRGEIHLYFDTATVIVTLVLAGKLIERGAKEKVSRWIAQLHRMMPNKVRLLAASAERFVSVEALEPGQTFVVKVGERVPCDGLIVDGESHADESLLTGECAPVGKKVGETVVAGSINLDGILHVQATKSAGDSTLARIIALVEKALSSRTDLERTVDRVSRIFVPCVVLIALLTFFIPWLTGTTHLAPALMRAITVLVIACPCALGLATPLAMTAAFGAASRSGILVRDGRVLETLRRIDTVILDKTGTVTEGRFSLLEFVPCHSTQAVPSLAGLAISARSKVTSDSDSPSADDTLSLLASLERYSEHPLGVAVAESGRKCGLALQDVTSVEIHKGRGITGVVDGKSVFAGNRRLASDLGIRLDHYSTLQVNTWEQEGKTVAFVGYDGELTALAVFGDQIKPDVCELIREFHRRHIQVHLVSGDAHATTQYTASQIGADSFAAEVLPEEKATFVRNLQEGGSAVAMVGDGINDAPALAQADLGIALSSGADIAMQAAAVVIVQGPAHGSLRKMLDVFDLSRLAVRVVRQNLFWAFFYNLIGITLAVTGVLSPIFAAVAMLLSSTSVVANSLRLSRRDFKNISLN